MEAQCPAPQFPSGFSGVHFADAVNGQSDGKFGHRVGILSGSIHHHHAFFFRIYAVDVVVPCAGAYDDLQLGGMVEHLAVDDVAADDHGLGIGTRLQELRLRGIFFKKGHIVTCLVKHLRDFGQGFGCEWLIGCHQYFSHYFLSLNNKKFPVRHAADRFLPAGNQSREPFG